MKMVTNLAGVTFLEQTVKDSLENGLISVGDKIHIEQHDYSKNESTSVYDGDYSVCCKGSHIGWIPQLNTIKSYIRKEKWQSNETRLASRTCLLGWQNQRLYYVGFTQE